MKTYPSQYLSGCLKARVVCLILAIPWDAHGRDRRGRPVCSQGGPEGGPLLGRGDQRVWSDPACPGARPTASSWSMPWCGPLLLISRLNDRLLPSSRIYCFLWITITPTSRKKNQYDCKDIFFTEFIMERSEVQWKALKNSLGSSLCLHILVRNKNKVEF